MASVPGPPNPKDPTAITSSSFFFSFTKGPNNGAAQTEFYMRYAKNLNFSNATTYQIAETGATIDKLQARTTYYAQARSRNAKGYSDWSRIVRIDTIDPPIVQPTVGDAIAITTPSTPPTPPPDPPAYVPPTIYIPDAPTPFYIDAQGSNGFHYSFHAPSPNNGSIQELQVGFGTDPNNVQNTTSVGLVGGNGDAFVYGLTRNTVYYVWSRARNEAGWGPWSGRSDIRTLPLPPNPPSPAGTSNVTQVSVNYFYNAEDDGGANIEEFQIGYGTNPDSVEYYLSPNGSSFIGGLTPYTLWYFWVRARNSQGWSSWSVRTEVRTKAGALVLTEGSYKEAIPYVKADGAWRVVQPFVKRTGVWKSPI